LSEGKQIFFFHSRKSPLILSLLPFIIRYNYNHIFILYYSFVTR